MWIASIRHWRHSFSVLALPIALSLACSSSKNVSKDTSGPVAGGTSASAVASGGSNGNGQASGGASSTSYGPTSITAAAGGIEGSSTAVPTGGAGVSAGTTVNGGAPTASTMVPKGGTNASSSAGAATSAGGTRGTSTTSTKAVGGTTTTSTKVASNTGGASTTSTKAAGGTGGVSTGGTPAASGSGGTTTPTNTTVPSDIMLPVPRITDDTHPVLEALSRRQSTRAFSSAELSITQQSEIVWAAFGVNRPADANKRTAPSAWNCQDIDPYLVTSAGVFKYNAPQHALDLVASTDVRSQLGAPYSTAPLTLVYVSTQSKISSTDKTRYSYLHTGLIGMNVYLYAAYENLPVVIRDSAPSGFTQSLNLTSDQAITLVQTIGLPSGQSNPDGVPFQAGSLVAPRTSTHPILIALMNRKSAAGFAAAALTDQVLGEILWSGFGVNRADGKRTAPSANNGQDVDIYALMASGAYRYDAANHALTLVSATDARPLASAAYASAPLTLVLVSNYSKISSASVQERYASADTGFIAQNVYAYCASEGLAARVYESIADSSTLQARLQLTSDQHIVLVQTVGPNP